MRLLLFFLLLAAGFSAQSQRIVYSEPHKDDTRRMDFEIIGKVGGNFLIYKNVRNLSFISVYDNEMNELSREEHKYLPDERLINVDFFPYADHSYMIYQYQKKNIVHCKAVKIDANGKKVSDEIELDTTHIGFNASNKLYSVVTSEDKTELMVFKINSRNKSRYYVTTVLFDEELNLKKRSRFVLPMEEHDDYLDEFNVDNEGDFVFTKFNRTSNETIKSTILMWKPAASDSLYTFQVPYKDIWLDEPIVKVDNANKRYFLTSFYYKEKRGNIEGFYFYVWDKTTQQQTMQNTVVLGPELRKEAKGDANIKMAFNDYFVRNVIVKKDGGFIINSEAYYTTSRFGNWNRWNYLYGSPVLSAYDYYTFNSPYNSWMWRNRFNSGSSIRHHADNITVLSFDKDGKLQWSNVIHKEQFDDEGDERISYQFVNTGSQIHYLFNLEEKRALLLNDYTLTPSGQMNRNPTLKNLDRGYEFMPKFAKQVSSKQMIIPCYYRNYISFAKIEFN